MIILYMFKEHHPRTTIFVHFYVFFRKFWDISQIIRLEHILTHRDLNLFFIFFEHFDIYLIFYTPPTRFSHTHITYIHIYIRVNYTYIYIRVRSIHHSFEEASSHTKEKKKKTYILKRRRKKNVNRGKKNDAVRFFKGTTSTSRRRIFFLNLTHHNNTVGTRKTSDCEIEFRCELQRFVFSFLMPFSVSRHEFRPHAPRQKLRCPRLLGRIYEHCNGTDRGIRWWTACEQVRWVFHTRK